MCGRRRRLRVEDSTVGSPSLLRAVRGVRVCSAARSAKIRRAARVLNLAPVLHNTFDGVRTPGVRNTVRVSARPASVASVQHVDGAWNYWLRFGARFLLMDIRSARQGTKDWTGVHFGEFPGFAPVPLELAAPKPRSEAQKRPTPAWRGASRWGRGQAKGFTIQRAWSNPFQTLRTFPVAKPISLPFCLLQGARCKSSTGRCLSISGERKKKFVECLQRIAPAIPFHWQSRLDSEQSSSNLWLDAAQSQRSLAVPRPCPGH